MVNSIATDYIEKLIKELLPECKVELLNNIHSFDGYTFLVTINSTRIPIKYSFELIEDFNVALEKLRNTLYYYSLISKVRFIALTKLAEEGLLDTYLISEEFFSEKRDWIKEYRVNIKLDKEFTQFILEGLNELSKFLANIISNSKYNVEGIIYEKNYIDSLITYHKEEGNLDSKGAETESLSFLKAAALCKILLLEEEREKQVIPRIKISITKTIIFIVAKLRSTPFLDIKLPECIYDYKLSITVKMDINRVSSDDNSLSSSDNFWKSYSQQEDYRDIFICHSSEDKSDIIKPLLLKCIERKITFWFDNAEIKWGDSLTAKINEGLKISKYVLVVLSNNFLKKNWPKKELEAALNLEFSTGVTKVLPLIVGSKEERDTIIQEYPILNNKLYLPWDLGIEVIIERLIERLKI